jgi:pSer/pThr/pTyr-binding forkhead associated (FHA) protein
MYDDKAKVANTMVAPQIRDVWTITNSEGNTFEVNDKVNIGRGEDNEVCIDDARISRHHAKLFLNDEQLFVEDLNSTNGCYVNDNKVDGKASIVSGDKLSFDNHHFTATGPKLAMNEKTVVSVSPLRMDQKQMEQSARELQKTNSVQAHVFEQAIPNSWVEQPCGEGTQLLSVGDIKEGSASDFVKNNSRQQPRLSDSAHLILMSNGLAQEVIELTADQDRGLWEIGREQHCQVQIDDPSISSKHAQIIFKSGRWSIANLLSTNGIEHNGERKLSAFLSDGDHLRLGIQHLMFFSDIHSNTATSSPPNDSVTNNRIKYLSAALVVVIFVLGIVVFKT